MIKIKQSSRTANCHFCIKLCNLNISEGNVSDLVQLLSASGEDFHPTTNSLIHGTHVPSKESINRMVDDVEKQ